MIVKVTGGAEFSWRDVGFGFNWMRFKAGWQFVVMLGPLHLWVER